MRTSSAQLPDDIEALKRLVLEREAQLEIERHNVRAQQTLIEYLKLQIAKLKRMQFGRSSEKLNAQIEQLELIVEDLEEEQARTQPEAVTDAKVAKQAPVRRPLPEHLPRETVRHEPEAGCPECGGNLKAIGEDVAEMLEYVPASFKVIRHVRPRMACTCDMTCAALPGWWRSSQSRNSGATSCGRRRGIMLAAIAPASRAACRMRSISWPVRTGITGATITRTGTPASARPRIIRNRVAGAGARGSICRARSASSVVIETPTVACPFAAIAPSRSASRITVAPRVTSATGWFQSCNTCRQPRMMPSFDSMG